MTGRKGARDNTVLYRNCWDAVHIAHIVRCSMLPLLFKVKTLRKVFAFRAVCAVTNQLHYDLRAITASTSYVLKCLPFVFIIITIGTVFMHLSSSWIQILILNVWTSLYVCVCVFMWHMMLNKLLKF